MGPAQGQADNEPDFGPPSTFYDLPGGLLPGHKNTRTSSSTGDDFAEFHPILTTDFFEFGTATNKLESDRAARSRWVMPSSVWPQPNWSGPPDWAVVRNISDPGINADLPRNPKWSSTCRRLGGLVLRGIRLLDQA